MDIRSRTDVSYATAEELEAGLAAVRAAPGAVGTLDLIVRRPAEDEREILEEGELDLRVGLVGDNWQARSSRRSADGGPHPDMQLNIISSRVSALLADTEARRALAGDQLHIDLDLSEENLPPGTRLAIGEAVVEVTEQPHTGCLKFRERFGKAAHVWVSGPDAMAMRLRGANAKVVVPGIIRRGDTVEKRS